MPFYEYQCKSCGHALEAMQKITAAPLKKCPDCGKPQLVRLMSAPVFRLKGGGWYETDFKGDKDNQRNLADKPEAPDSSKDTKVADPKGKEDAKAPDTKSAEAATAKETPAAKDKSADKPKEKSSTEKPAAASKAPAGKSSARSRLSKRPAKGKRRR